MVYDLEIIASTFRNPEIKVISFDIFDTLIERPVVYPEDIFVLLKEEVNTIIGGKKNFDFYQIRKNLETEAKEYYKKQKNDNYEIRFDQIYDYFGKKYNLSKEQVDRISCLEKTLERQITTARRAGKELYDIAMSTGKKIICISDMYHDSSFLDDILNKNGFNKIQTIYVSSEINKRKDTGELFDFVLEKEGLAPCQIVHVGDNYNSDFIIPLKKGIVAHHLPSSRELFYHSKSEYKKLWNKISDYTPHQRIVIGFYINKWASELYDTEMFFPEKKHLGFFGVGPVLLSVAQYLKGNSEIQNKYPTIHFASRDGYLPQKAYDLLCESSGKKYIPSVYLYCGRRLYNSAHFDGININEYFINTLNKTIINEDVSIEVLFDSLFYPNIIDDCNGRKNISIIVDKKNDYKIVKDLIKQKKNEITNILNNKKNNIKQYYNTVVQFSNNNRALIFDCGYSGSVSDAIGSITGKKIDKVYIWETEKNKELDKNNATKTYLMYGDFSEINKFNLFFFFEEVFSSIETSCIDIQYSNDNFIPIFDATEIISEHMINDLQEIQKSSLDFIKCFKKTLGQYIDNLIIDNIKFSIEPVEAAFLSKTDLSIRHLDRIIFPDKFCGNFRLLSEKLEPIDKEFLYRTNFFNSKIVTTKSITNYKSNNLRIAVHIHLYYIEQAAVFIQRLKKWELPFDLYITICDEKYFHIIKILFNNEIIPRLNQLHIKVVPNRGRDVAPWIIGFGKELQNYNYVCHVHSKSSPHFTWGNKWRDYLLDNLIENESVVDIINIFENNKKLGLIFPPIYEKIYNIWITNTHLEDIDRINCNKLLKKMGINRYISRGEYYFPVGTMFWYRTNSLAQLFKLGLKIDDFHSEPIPITGTIAHAIERILSLVAEEGGYKTLCYINQRELIGRYFDRMLYYGELEHTRGELNAVYNSKKWRIAVKLEKIARKTGLIYVVKGILNVYFFMKNLMKRKESDKR
jgi:FMN phosphatase YigB (HAD superfamily)